MIRKVLFVFSAILIFWTPPNVEARGERAPWQVLDEALTYLHSMPEVAWVKFYEHKVFISWKSRPGNFKQINRVAAKKAAHALHNEVTLYSLPASEILPSELWDYEPSFLCKTVANPREIVESNCR